MEFPDLSTEFAGAQFGPGGYDVERKELEQVLKELVVGRIDEIAEDLRRLDSNVSLIAEKLLSPIEQRQLKVKPTAGSGGDITPPMAQAAKGSRS